MKTTVVVFLLACIAIAPCLAGTNPSVTAQANVVGDSKVYTYTLLNDLDSQVTIYSFSLWMPKYGALSVINFACSKSNWSTGGPSVRGDIGVWGIGSATGQGILPGEQVTFTLVTPASVPTSDTYKPPFDVYPSNWQWGSNFGPSLLPVPVPEPSSILALAGGIVGLGGLVLRRRRA